MQEEILARVQGDQLPPSGVIVSWCEEQQARTPNYCKRSCCLPIIPDGSSGCGLPFICSGSHSYCIGRLKICIPDVWDNGSWERGCGQNSGFAGTTVTWVGVTVHKVEFLAIPDTRSPVNIISSHLVMKINMTPNFNHAVVYSMAGLTRTKSIGAYLALPLCFGKIVLTAPAVVLNNEGYDLIIGTQFLMDFDWIVNHQEVFMSLLKYCVPLAPANLLVMKGLWKRRTCLLEYATNILSLNYHVTQTKMQMPLPSVVCDEGIPVYPTASEVILAKSHTPIPTGIQMSIPKVHLVTISSIRNTSPCKLFVCPDVLKPS